MCNADSSFNVAILRYFNPVGAHKSKLIGKSPNGIPNNLMHYITKVSIGELPYLNIYGNDYDTHDSTGVRDYIHVLDLVNTYSKVNNIDIPYKIVERRPGDIDKCFADPTKANNQLDWYCKYNLEDMCRDSYNFQTSKLKKLECCLS